LFLSKLVKSPNSPEKPVFTLLPPHYHNDTAWKFVIKSLEERGYQAHAPHLDISDPDLTRDDHATTMREAEEKIGAENFIRAGSSWGGDLIYRQIGSRVSKLVFMGAPLRQVLYKLGAPKRTPDLANHATLPYASYVAAEKEFNREELAKIFYKRLGSEAMKEYAIDNLEPHPHVHEDPLQDKNAVLPIGVDMAYIGFMYDEILPYTNQALTARYFDMEFTPFPTGHFAMYENPAMLAQLLAEIARGQVKKPYWSNLYEEERHRKLDASPIEIKT
jgi:pimeloyl-ACP methyl ester carboxylesterase